MKSISYIACIIVGAVIMFFLMKGCGKPIERTTKVVETDTIVKIKTEIDTFYRDTGSIKAIPYFVQLPAEIDTPASILDYYTFKSVKDSLIGKNYKVLLDDKLYMNSLFSRKAHISVTQTDSLIHTTTTIRKSADGLYLGMQTNLKDISPSVMYLKGKSAYGIGYGIREKEIQLMYYRKIGK